MDSAYVSLILDGLENFRCEKQITLEINLLDFSKILKMAQNDDVGTLKIDVENSFLIIIFDNTSNQLKLTFNLRN
jgi:hypothetical protein